MKKQSTTLSLLMLSTLLLASCGNSAKVERFISLYQNDSKIYLASVDEKSTFILKTYHHKKFGDAPYVDMAELMTPYFAYAEYSRNFEKVSDGVFKITRPSGDKNGSIVFDVKKQKITIINAAGIYTDVFGLNNGLGDFAAGAKLIRGSSKTKIVKQGTPREIDLKPYGYQMVEQDGKLFVPASLLSGLLFAPATSGLSYNGRDYFVRQSFESANVSSLALSSSRGFAYNLAGATSKQFFKPVAVKDAATEAYRYEAKLNVSSVEGAKVELVLKKDGTGFAKSNENPIMPAVDKGITWSEDGDVITMSIYQTLFDEIIGMPTVMKISRDDKSYFGLTSRSESLAQDNYRGLCFSLDLNFGLKSFKGISSFDEFFTSKGRKDALLSTNPETYQDAVAKFIYSDFDEMHSVASEQSYYGNFDNNIYFSAKAEQYSGARNKQFIVDLSRAKTLFEKAENERENYTIQGDTAVLKFDSFRYVNDLKYDDESYQTEDYAKAQKAFSSAWMNNNTYKAIAIAFNDILKKGEDVKNIVFDIAMNLGGEVRVMPLLSAFYNKDPNIIVKNNIDGSIVDLHYEADLNGDDKFATDEDSFEGKYNFYFLTGHPSFSCGNAFPTMAKNSKKAKVIGEVSGGGSCMVNAFVTLDGLCFNTSSAYQFMLENGENEYVYNENGVPLDYEYSLDNAYNLPKLVEFLGTLTNGD